jgi:hypothetical protein
MAEENKPDPAVIAKFKVIQQYQWIAGGTMVLFVCGFVFADQISEVIGISKGATVMMMAMVPVAVGLFAVANWRCPACSKYLNQSPLTARFCGRCGVRLRE